MRVLTKTGVAVLIVLVGAVTQVGCVGTPMPLPPSNTPPRLDEERLSLSIEEEGCEPDLLEGECLNISGVDGATEPFSSVFVHSLSFSEIGVSYDTDVRADENGAFEVAFLGDSNVGFRVIIHGENSAMTRNLIADTSETQPWPTVPFEEYESCMEFSTDIVSFGDQTVGTTTTELVQVTNVCDEGLESFGAYMAFLGESEVGEFGALASGENLEPGESMDLVVAFWPEEVRDHIGVVVVEMMTFDGMEFLRMSLPVRGRSVPR